MNLQRLKIVCQHEALAAMYGVLLVEFQEQDEFFSERCKAPRDD